LIKPEWTVPERQIPAVKGFNISTVALFWGSDSALGNDDEVDEMNTNSCKHGRSQGCTL
jgi:hypothetical protein